MITVFNKADRLEEPVGYPKIVGEDKIYLSAKEPESLALLTKMILDKIYAEYTLAEFLIPYEKGQIASYFMEHSHMVCQEYGEKGIRITTKCHMADKDKYKIYLIE